MKQFAIYEANIDDLVWSECGTYSDQQMALQAARRIEQSPRPVTAVVLSPGLTQDQIESLLLT